MTNESNNNKDTGMCEHVNFPASCEACKVDREAAVKTERKIQRIGLAKEIIEVKKDFPFSGVSAAFYEKSKKDELDYPDYIMTTPIDELLKRFEGRGMKVVLGKNPDSGNIFVLPLDSDDIEMDGILIQKLEPSVVDDDQLRVLIILSQK